MQVRFDTRYILDGVFSKLSGKTMDEKKAARALSVHLALPPPPPPTVAVAINGKKKSKYVAFWALEKFIPEGFSDFKLLYVRPPVTYIPTPSKLPLTITTRFRIFL